MSPIRAKLQVPSGRRFARAGFSLVELVVCLGIIMILVGLLLPSIAGIHSRGRLAREMVVLHQHAAAIDAYTADFEGVYPLSSKNPFWAAQAWWKSLIAAGHYQSVGEVDPTSLRLDLPVSYWMSQAMVQDPATMRPGETVPIEEAVSSPIRHDQVYYPSAKGLVFRFYDRHWNPSEGGVQWCCTALWEFPVAMADGSATSGTYIDFNGGNPLYLENEMGRPVATTWFGCRGRDRR
jgi:type II secretory pathway pseudopilin PulG